MKSSLGQHLSNSIGYPLGMKNEKRALLRHILQPSFDPKQFSPQRLFDWLARPRNPVFASSDPLAKMFIRAMLKGDAASFIYFGVSTPGAPRTVIFSLVFSHETEGIFYVGGYCQARQSNRVFALDLIMTLT